MPSVRVQSKTSRNPRSLLNLYCCGLSTVPAFLGELKSLESLNLSSNADLQIDAPLDFLVEGCPPPARRVDAQMER